MFELSVAFKYLVPKWRQLSVSIISLISVCVIALVVWLITVFFSVTMGLEKSWVQKLIALTAPIRVYPTDHYYNSYYYLADSISQDSNYTQKSIGEKLASFSSNPYNADFDQEIPLHWPKPHLDENGQLVDPVKLAFETIHQVQKVPGLSASEYEMTVANIKLQFAKRDSAATSSEETQEGKVSGQSVISQAAYIGSYDSENKNLIKAMLSPSKKDVKNLFKMAWVDTSVYPDEEEGLFEPASLHEMDQSGVLENLKSILKIFRITAFKAADEGCKISLHFLNDRSRLKVSVLKAEDRIKAIFVPQKKEHVETLLNRKLGDGIKAFPATLTKSALVFDDKSQATVEEETPILVEKGALFHANLDTAALEWKHSSPEICFDAALNVQGQTLTGKIGLDHLELADLSDGVKKDLSPWAFQNHLLPSLPSDTKLGDAILLPKSYRIAGVLVGDRGRLTYQTATLSSVQEQRIPIWVAGFYDPGILPLGGKIILANPYVVSMIRSSYPSDHSPITNGINVRIQNLEDADYVKSEIANRFKERGIDKYWKIETYKEFEFTKDLLQQLQSERNLFTLISIIIIIVACSNIISMLIILVNNKKQEIGILRAMGASSKSIAMIFGTCGMVMGLAGSLIGLAAALLTLRNLQVLIHLISKAQGFEMFNPAFYGEALPNEVSLSALTFVLITTTAISLIAGVIPAVKACLVRPSTILRSE